MRSVQHNLLASWDRVANRTQDMILPRHGVGDKYDTRTRIGWVAWRWFRYG